MSTSSRSRFVPVVGLAAVAVSACILLLACRGATTPLPIIGPEVFGNETPTMEFTAPTDNLSVNKGDIFEIAWSDSDPDSAAQITLDLVATQTGAVTTLITGLDENDRTGPDSWTVNTALLAEQTYFIRGTITDGINPPFVTFAETAAGVGQRVAVTVTPPGLAPTNAPPTVAAIEPSFPQSVAQDDALFVLVQPVRNQNPDNPIPYDEDSDTTLYIVADLDEDPTNDDVLGPEPDELIVLRTFSVAEGSSAAFPPEGAPIVVDLGTLPPRPTGEPYFIRATIDDGVNPQVHSYAPGTVNVVRSVSGTVFLEGVGKTLAGARFQGFNAGAQLGTTVEGVSDYDADGVGDFVLVAQFGNPRNRGNVGEAYLIYGLPNGQRFGGAINVNSISQSISGAILEAPAPVFPVGTDVNGFVNHTTMGISDAGWVEDFDGDGRPELLFGLPHVDGAWLGADWDPGDSDPREGVSALGCYPDFLPNNLSDTADGVLVDDTFQWAGFATVISSQIRDGEGISDPDRLDRATVPLDHVGQPAGVLVDGTDHSIIGPDGNRIHGLRVMAGWYDFYDAFFLLQPPLNAWFGYQVASMPDVNNDQTPELIFSAPRNELDILEIEQEFGFSSTHLASRGFLGSIMVFSSGPQLFNEIWRLPERTDAGGTNLIPNPSVGGGTCSDPPAPRSGPFVPVESFEVFAEDVTDFLHDGGPAGDVNLDSVQDLLCGAPYNDRSASLTDTGAAYVIYGRTSFDFANVDLSLADDPPNRPPMIRVRGETAGDRVGWKQVSVTDINGDRIDDVVLGAPYTDFGPFLPQQCGGDFNGDGQITNDDLSLSAFNGCEEALGDEVFFDDSCKAFDYNNDRMIDEFDREVLECLIAGGGANCCPIDNGFVGVVFGGVTLDGDRTISQIATADLPGVIFFGANRRDLAGWDVASAGDFNRDNFGDILIAAPGVITPDENGRNRLGAAYLIFGGTHLENRSFSLDRVGTDDLPGLVLVSPFRVERPNEAPITTVNGLGDVNADLFGDIAIGIPRADFVDENLPQDPDDPGTDPNIGRRANGGDVYLIYGSNVGTNR